jgi:hypothetical protein
VSWLVRIGLRNRVWLELTVFAEEGVGLILAELRQRGRRWGRDPVQFNVNMDGGRLLVDRREVVAVEVLPAAEGAE